jgi:hypothetical protein
VSCGLVVVDCRITDEVKTVKWFREALNDEKSRRVSNGPHARRQVAAGQGGGGEWGGAVKPNLVIPLSGSGP